MKKTLALYLLLLGYALGYAQPEVNGLTFRKTVGLFDLYEISFQMGTYSNPYDPEVIHVYAEFVSPDGKTLKVNGFYYEGYQFSKQNDIEKAVASRDQGWRIRFTPDQVGQWHFSLHAIDRDGTTTIDAFESKPIGFQCLAVESAQGFIAVDNSRFLKRDIVENGMQKSHAFFPCGPNVAWYEYSGSASSPRGIYDYEKYIDTLDGNANYIRIWLNRYQYLSLYGPEYTQKDGNKTMVYFDSTLNQKDAAELDFIIEYAAQHGISIMPCIFSFGDFLENGTYKGDASCWKNNPFHTILGLKAPTDFFTDNQAQRITKNLIRYVVARWGYATNIVCWEFWNEVDNINHGDLSEIQFQRDIVSWHKEMANYTRSIDPFKHPLTTSCTTFDAKKHLDNHVFKALDITQWHSYGNIQKAVSKEQRAHRPYEKQIEVFQMYPRKPFFIGEFGFGQEGKNKKYREKDPFGFDTHNTIWASLFSTSMGPISFWYWNYLNSNNLWDIYKPVVTFVSQLPRLSKSFKAYHTASIEGLWTRFPNGIQTYYMMNAAEDTLYGWCQDTAYSYQALRRLTDREGRNGHFDDDGVFDPDGYVYTLNPAKKPHPSSGSNEIILPIRKQTIGTQYVVRWFDGETGLEISSENDTVVVQGNGLFRPKTISFDFPSCIRDVENQTVSTKFGDAAFIITVNKGTKNESNAESTSPKKVKTIRVELEPNQ